MDWSAYTYLAAVAVAAAALFAAAAKLVPSLIQPRETRSRPAAELLLLVLIIAIGSVTIYGACLFGGRRFGYWDVGSDTLEQYAPFYEDMISGLRAGDFGAWDFHYGLGSSFMAYASWSNDPFNLITISLAMLLGTARLGRILALVQCVKILLSGLLFDHLLTFYCRAPLSRIVGSSLFAFGGWLILWGQHYWIGAVYAMYCLMALVLELLMERWSAPRFFAVMAATAASVLMSVYAGFMVMLFATAYALLRSGVTSGCSSLGQYPGFFFGRLAVPVVCGLLCSCVLVVPYAVLILGESSRVTAAGGMSFSERFVSYLTGFVPAGWLPLILSRILGNGLVETGGIFSQTAIPYTDAQSYLMNSYEFITVGVGGAALVLGSQGLGFALRRGSRRSRAASVLALTLTVLFCVNFFLPALSSAFDLKFRASFALTFPLLIAASVGWERMVGHHEVLWPELVVSVLATLAILVWSLSRTANGRLVCLWFLLAATVAVVALLLCGRAQGASPLVAALACAAVISMPVVDGFFSTNARDMATQDNFPAATETDADTRDALAYLSQTDTDFYRIAKTYSDWTRLNDSLVQGYYGIGSYNSTTDSDVVEFYRQTWPDVLSAGGSKQDVTGDLSHPGLLDLLGVRYVLAKTPLDDTTWLEPVRQFGSVYLYRNSGATSAATFFGSSVTESAAAALSTEEREELLGRAVVVPDEVGETGSGSSATPAGTLRLTSGSSLDGSVDAPSDGIVFLAVPHTSGWTVSVDGEDVETFRADYGFIGFRVGQGSHDLVARYEPTEMTLGIALSLAGLGSGIAACLLSKRLHATRSAS